MASGGVDGSLFVWDTNGSLVGQFKEHKSAVCAVVWHPAGGSRLFSVAEKDKCVIEWQ